MNDVPSKPKRRMPRQDVSWWQNFKRWSTQLHIAAALLSVYELLPTLIGALIDNAHLYQPLLSDGQYATVVVTLNVFGVIARNLTQQNVT